MARLLTKASRLAVQEYEFNSLLTKGYTLEKYEDLHIFTMCDDSSSWLKIFRGTAAKEIVYKRYRDEAQSIQAVINAKMSVDRSKAYKAELKANPTKSSHSNCATAIRDELKKLYPLHKFSVRSESFAGGDAVRVSWTDGLTVPQVDEIIKKYQYGSFNGMEDIYEYSNENDNLPQSKFVSSSRTISDELSNAVKAELINLHPDLDQYGHGNISDKLHNILYDTEIPLNGVYTGLIERGEDEPYNRNYYKLSFDVPQTTEPEPTETANFEKVEVKTGEIQIIDYSERAIAVIGDTKPIKDQLKAIGGRFNFRLSCGSGWIFKKSDLEKVQLLLSKI